MKVLLLNGSPNERGCTFTALSEAAAEIEKAGIETETVNIGKKAVQGCTDCGSCRSHPGRCAFDGDLVNPLLARAAEFDGVIIGSPVYYSGPAGQLIAFLNRLFFASGGVWAYKPAAAVVSARRAGTTATFEQLTQYFTISNMPVVPSQYWNMVHGNTPDEVRQDLEGLQIMRTLGKNMAWMIKCIKAGEKAGIGLPEREKRVGTNFIR